jgi:hypothetical protein
LLTIALFSPSNFSRVKFRKRFITHKQLQSVKPNTIVKNLFMGNDNKMFSNGDQMENNVYSFDITQYVYNYMADILTDIQKGCSSGIISVNFAHDFIRNFVRRC